MTPEGAGLVADAAPHRGMGDRDRVEDRAHGDRRREVDLEAVGAARVRAQRRGQANDDPQRTTAGFTQSTGGR